MWRMRTSSSGSVGTLITLIGITIIQRAHARQEYFMRRVESKGFRDEW